MLPEFDFFHSRVCISSLLWRNQPIGIAAETMMRLGLVHLELSSSRLASNQYEPGGSNARLFNVLAEAGVKVAVLRLSGMSYDEKLASIEDAGKRGIPAVLDRAEALAYPALIDRVRTYAMLAQYMGVHMILENDFYTSCDNSAAQLSLANSVGCRGLGFGFAPMHALADQKDPADEVRALGDRLRMAYLWEAPVGMAVGRMAEDFNPGPPRDQAPGHAPGLVDWHDYFEALAAVNFRGILNLKWLGAEDWPAGQTEEAIVRAMRFCAAAAADAGFGDRPSQEHGEGQGIDNGQQRPI